MTFLEDYVTTFSFSILTSYSKYPQSWISDIRKPYKVGTEEGEKKNTACGRYRLAYKPNVEKLKVVFVTINLLPYIILSQLLLILTLNIFLLCIKNKFSLSK